MQHLEQFYYIMPEDETIQQLPEREMQPYYLLFDYETRDPLNHQAKIRRIGIQNKEEET